MPADYYHPHFASSTAIEIGSILATDADGTDAYMVLGDPRRLSNLVGGRTFLEFDVRLMGTGQTGYMTFSASDVVYLRTTD